MRHTHSSANLLTSLMIGLLACLVASPWAQAEDRYVVAADGTLAAQGEAKSLAPLMIVDGYDASGLDVDVSFSGLELSVEKTRGGDFTFARWPDAAMMGNVGEPALPVVRKLFCTPADAKVAFKTELGRNAVVEMSSVGLTLPLLPVQGPVSVDLLSSKEAMASGEIPFDFNTAAYVVDRDTPASRVEVTEVGVVRGMRLWQLEIRPVAYNPVRNELLVWHKIRVHLSFEGGVESRKALPAAVRGALLNPPVQVEKDDRAGGNYLIVAAENWAGSLALANFVAGKTAQGFDVSTYSVPSGTTKEAIKAYIQSLWGTADAPDYLLLVGEVDEIPYWLGGGTKSAPTDLPYACMDGVDDWYPDMAIGRFSPDSEADLQAMVDKTLFVEAGDFSSSDPTYVGRAAFMAGSDELSGDEAAHDEAIESYLEPRGYDCLKLYDRAYGTQIDDRINALNNGCFHLVAYGHSDAERWGSPWFEKDHVRNLTNDGLYPVVLSMTCRVGSYTEVDECFAETWLRVPNKGAVAFFGTTGTLEATSSPWAEVVFAETRYFESIYQDGILEIGPAWHATLTKLLAQYGASSETVRNYFEMFVLYGDPSLGVILPPPPNYQIIAAQGYMGSTALNTFVNARASQGFKVNVRAIAPGTSNTDIRSFLLGLWGTTAEPSFILLVGDTDGDTSTEFTIPHFTGGASKHTATDLPYGCMDGGDDWYPDIPVGRFSVTSTAMLQTVVNKTLHVETGNFPNPDYVKRGAFLANPGTQGMAEPTHDWVIDNLFTPNDYIGVKLYSAEGAGTSDVAAAVNEGCLWVGYYGHSGSTGWWDPSFDQGDVNNLTNIGLYGVAWSFSCNVGRYDYDECFGETWLRKANAGAAVVIFPSNYIYWGSVAEWTPSTVLEKSFFRAFFEDDIWRVGSAWQAGLYHFLEDYTSDMDVTRNFFELYNVMGDPSLRLPRPEGFTLAPTPENRDACVPPNTSVTYTIAVDQMGGFADAIHLEVVDLPSGATVDFSVNDQPASFVSVMTIGSLDSVADGEYTLTIRGTSGTKVRNSSVALTVSTDIPAVPTLVSPADGQVDAARQPLLTWQAADRALAYEVEIASDAGFGDVVYSGTVTETSDVCGVHLDSLAQYFWHVRAINGCGESAYSSTFDFTTLSQADYFTEVFIEGSEDMDLEYFTIEFAMTGGGSFYDMCGYEATELPTDPTGGTVVNISEDGAAHAVLTEGAEVHLYGVDYASLYICDNGCITFDGAEGVWQETLTRHFEIPRIAPLYDDFSVAAAGSVSWKQTDDRVAVTYYNVSSYGGGNSNTFQVEMFFNGDIHITWLGMDANDGIVGLSAGNGVPGDYMEMDLSAAGACYDPGACCLDGGCSIMDGSDCVAAGGTFFGSGSDCDPFPCAEYESSCLIISEVVTGGASGACPKWIEITNTGVADYMFMEGGIIVQADSSTDVDLDVDLTGVRIAAGHAFVIAANDHGACTGAFGGVYSADADFYTNVDFGDGGDRYILTDTADGSHVLDIYGVFGVDGDGLAWDYNEGYSYRLPDCSSGNGGAFNVDEWFFGGAGSLGLGSGNPEDLLRALTTPWEHAYDESCGNAGDMNCDGRHNGLDIEAFALALTDPAAYASIYACLLNGDFDKNALVDMDDVPGFVNAMMANYPPPPAGPITVFEDDFETDTGWIAENLGATSGDWQRGVPVDDDSWAYDPASDADGSGQCLLTQNTMGNTDVDDGAVAVTSPTLDLSAGDFVISYEYFLRLTDNDGTDRLLVEIDPNDGLGTWTEIERHDTNGGLSWRSAEITRADIVAAGVTPSATSKLRFTANDGDAQSIVEAGVDAFSVVIPGEE